MAIKLKCNMTIRTNEGCDKFENLYSQFVDEN